MLVNATFTLQRPSPLITVTLQVTHSQSQSRIRLILANSIQFVFSWFDLAIRTQVSGFG